MRCCMSLKRCFLEDVRTLELDSIICNADSIVRSESRESALGCGTPDARDVVEPHKLFRSVCIPFEPISFLGKELRCPVHLHSPRRVRDALLVFGSTSNQNWIASPVMPGRAIKLPTPCFALLDASQWKCGCGSQT